MFNRLIRHNGNKDLFEAVSLSAAALAGRHPFHLHAEGLRGTGKTTILRAAGQMLPPIVRVRGCIYNCHPDRPHCPDHRDLGPAEIARIGWETVPCPFLEISHSAKVGTVLGSIDLPRLVDRGAPLAAFLPGTILQAHRGVVFIDEINRLADTAPELADILLDVMGTKPGRVQVEETGLPVVAMPVEVTVWAASNPDEEPGPLAQVRKQLADRFDMAVTMGRPANYRAVMDILAWHQDGQLPGGEAEACFPAGDFHAVTVGEELRAMLAALYVDFGLESLRAVEGLETAARLAALKAGRRQATLADVAAAAPLVLSHRTDSATLAGILRHLAEASEGRDTWRRMSSDTGKERTGDAAPAGERAAVPSWGKWWAQIKRRLAANRSGRASAAGDGKAAGSGAGTSSAGAGANSIADPLRTAIVAPPNPAVPLADLPADKYVNGGGDSRHD